MRRYHDTVFAFGCALFAPLIFDEPETIWEKIWATIKVLIGVCLSPFAVFLALFWVVVDFFYWGFGHGVKSKVKDADSEI